MSEKQRNEESLEAKAKAEEKKSSAAGDKAVPFIFVFIFDKEEVLR